MVSQNACQSIGKSVNRETLKAASTALIPFWNYHERNVHSSQSLTGTTAYDATYKGASMEIQEALEVIRRLADGVHPENGDALSGDSLYQHPRAVRALNRAVQALELQQQRERSRSSLPANAGKPWSSDEDARICDELRHGTNFQEIARIHNRTAGSIVARLIRLGKIASHENRSTTQQARSA